MTISFPQAIGQAASWAYQALRRQAHTSAAPPRTRLGRSSRPGSGRVAAVLVAACLWACPIARADEFRPTAQSRIVPAGATVETLWLDGEFTEGPTPGAQGAIFFSDIGNRILQFDPESGETREFRQPSGRANGLKFDPEDRLIVCEGANTGGGRRLSITEPDGTIRTLADAWRGRRFNSPNDLVLDRQGRIYFSDPRYVGDEPRELDFEGVFVVSPAGQVELATSDVHKPNGIVLSPDGKRAYVADTGPQARQLLVFTVQPDGRFGVKRVLFDFGDDRGIDGMTVDVEGNVYAAAGRGPTAGIFVFSPDGLPLARIALAGEPSNCCFGRRDEASTLYITGQGALPAEASAGDDRPRRHGLFRIRLLLSGFH